MRVSRRAAVGVTCLAVLGASISTAVATTTPSIRLVRTKAVLPGLAHATRLGTTSASTRLTVGLGLAHPNSAGEEAAYHALYTKGSGAYHQFLTPAQYADTFGVSRATASAARAWLRSGGLDIESTTAARDYITATGTVSQIAKLMHTHFATFKVGPLRFVANTVAPEVPAALPVTAVLGLNTLERAWTQFDVARVNKASGIVTPALKPKALPSAGAPYAGVYTPQNMWGIYDLPKTNEGQGQKAGLFMEGYTNSITANLRIYERRNHLPAVPVRAVRSGKGSDAEFGDNTDAIEWYLDSDAITGMAPKLAELDLYTTKNLFDVQVAAEFGKWAGDARGPQQMNASFGECEQSPANPVFGPLAQPPFYYGSEAGDELEAAAEPMLRQANLEGRTLFASSGDTGGSCPAIVVPVLGAGNGVTPQPVPEQNYPAASPHVTSVGGTVVQTQGKPSSPTAPAKRADEAGWTYSGGGQSFYIAEPAYQKKVKNVDRPCISKPDGTPYPPGTICRGVPDIADMSGTVFSYQFNTFLSENFYDIEQDMTDTGEGGTSLSSPLAVGMWSRIQAGAPKRSGLGFANETIYKVGTGKNYHRDFHDITTSETQGGNFYYQAGPGWDYVSGFGAFDVKNFMQDVDHRLTPSHPTAQRPVPVRTNGCATFTSPFGNANNALNPLQKDPSIDITNATLRQSGKNLIATIGGQTLSKTAPTGASGGSDFYLLWSVGPTTYFGGAIVDNQGNVKFVDGMTGGSYNVLHTIKGTFKGGTITLTIPKSQVGSPKKGTVLAYPYAMSQYGLSGPTVATNPLYFTEDVATAADPGQGVRIGATCRAH